MEILNKIKSEILTPIIALVFAVAVGYFLFGVLGFIRNRDNETGQVEGKQHMLWGIIGMAIMVGVLGILNLISESVKGLV